MNLIERSDKVLSKVLGHYTDLEVVRGKGAYLFDVAGQKYLDFASGIAVTNTGHCHPEVVKAAVAQTKKIIHNCAGVTYTAANIEFAESLQKIVPIRDSRIFLNQSGSEAVEGALKVAKYVSKKSGIIALQGGFHGRTMGALSVTSSKKLYTEGYGPLMPNTYFAEANLESIQKCNNGNIAAVILELVQGEFGYVAQDPAFVRQLREYCTANKIFLIVDEVQSGFMRTGKMFACDWYDLEPDILALAKGIASGFPLGAVVIKKEISDQWKTSTHGGTFTGNLVACAAGTATLKVLKKAAAKMPARIKKINQLADNLIAKNAHIFPGRQGLGYMMGLKCASAEINTALRKKALQNKLLLINCGPHGEVIRLAPPVNISLADLTKGFALLEKSANAL